MKNLNLLNLIFVFVLLFSCACSGPVTLPENKNEPKNSKHYTLGPDDVIGIEVWQEEELSKTVTIRPDGKVTLPFIDDVQAAGLTTEELKTLITEKLKEFITDPVVSIVVLQMNSMKVFVQGEVVRQGVYELKSNTTILQAISMAGGFNAWSKRKKVTIIRDINGKRARIIVDYGKIVSGDDLSQNIVLRRGDIIIVP